MELYTTKLHKKHNQQRCYRYDNINLPLTLQRGVISS